MGQKRSGHQTARLSDPQIKQAIRETDRDGKRRVLTDGRGLDLVIMPGVSGALARWRQRIMIAGSRTRPEGGHGTYPFVGLSTARSKANAAYALARAGKDPFPKSRDSKQPSVAGAVRAYQARRVQAGRVKREGAADKFKIFERHAKPIADRPISALTLNETAALLDRIKINTATRVDAGRCCLCAS